MERLSYQFGIYVPTLDKCGVSIPPHEGTERARTFFWANKVVYVSEEAVQGVKLGNNPEDDELEQIRLVYAYVSFDKTNHMREKLRRFAEEVKEHWNQDSVAIIEPTTAGFPGMVII